ncbi:beta-lactamase superfamily II metal-dependent hydrolase [Mucilaginibacter sp. UYNi724]
MSSIKTPSKTQVLVLPAYHGDSIIVKTIDGDGKPFYMVIDGGTAKTYDDTLKLELRKLAFIDILVLTHIDSDHIAGLIKFIKDPFFKTSQIGKYWFNSKNIKFLRNSEKISFGQAKSFEELLIDKGEIKGKWSEDIYIGVTPALPPGIIIEVLSPTADVLKELYSKWPDLSDDYNKKLTDINIANRIVPSQIGKGSLPDLAAKDDNPEKSVSQDLFNSSSIAFVLQTFDLSIFLLGDAHPEIIKQVMISNGYSVEKRLKVDLVKISHHGSKNNTINDVLDMIDCDRFIISTNGGNSTHAHPDRETIARIIYHPERVRRNFEKHRKIYLNYPKANIEVKAGKFIEDSDLITGNWELVESTNIFEHE